MKLLLVGGDRRFIYLRDLLRRDGHEVSAFGLGDDAPLEKAASGARACILPLPALDREGNIPCPLSGKSVSPALLRSALAPDCAVFAGKAEGLRSLFPKVRDYYQEEALLYLNASITAEGALRCLMDALPITLREGRFLVTGGGRIGLELCRRLRALGADTACLCRSALSLVRAAELGVRAVSDRDGELWAADAIINTVPSPILGQNELSLTRPDVFLLELASPPYGFDMGAAGRLGRGVSVASAIPGRYAPKSAAGAIHTALRNMLTEL